MSAVIDDHGHADGQAHGPAKGLMRWVLTTNHKDIGTLYLWFSFCMFLLGGSFAMVIRAELFQPGLQIVAPAFFNQMTTMHGLIMVFGAVMPAFVGLANWMIPLMIGAPDMALPRMNNFSFWLLPAAFGLLISTLIFFWQFQERHQLPFNRASFAAVLYMITLYKQEKGTGGYSIGQLRISSIVFSKWLSLLIAQVLAFAVEYHLYHSLLLPSHLISVFLSALFALIWAYYGNKLALTLIRPLKTIVVYDKNHVWDMQRINYPFPKQLEVIGKYDITHGLDSISEHAEGAEVLYLYKIPSELRDNLLKFATSKGLHIYIQPKLGDLILNSTKQSNIFNLPVLRHNSRDSMSVYNIGKRAFDILGSLFILIATFPVFIAVMILIKIDDRGPIFISKRV